MAKIPASANHSVDLIKVVAEAPKATKQSMPSAAAPVGVSSVNQGDKVSISSDTAKAAPSTKKSKSLPQGEPMEMPKPHKI